MSGSANWGTGSPPVTGTIFSKSIGPFPIKFGTVISTTKFEENVMKTVTAALLFAAALAMGSLPAFAEGETAPQPQSTTQAAKQDIKDGAHAVGTAAKETTRAIGHGARKATKAIGHGTRDVVHSVGQATSKAWHEATQ